MAGTDAASVSVEEFIDKGATDEHRHELFARALAVAQDAAWRNKRRALGRALAAGVLGDDARVDEEMLFIRAVDDLDEVHVRLPGHLANGGRPTAGDIALTDPGLRSGLLALLGRLQSVGLIDSRAPVTPAGAMTPEPYYFVTDLGRDSLFRLADEALTSSESKPAFRDQDMYS
jgi:hypothetical protein